MVNNSGCSIASLPLSSPNQPIFGFDEDGPCTVDPNPGTCSSDPSGYGGPGVFFDSISADTMSGRVVFNPPLKNGGSTWFGLEEALVAGDIQVTVGNCASAAHIPTLSGWGMAVLVGTILLMGGLTLRRRAAA